MCPDPQVAPFSTCGAAYSLTNSRAYGVPRTSPLSAHRLWFDPSRSARTRLAGKRSIEACPCAPGLGIAGPDVHEDCRSGACTSHEQMDCPCRCPDTYSQLTSWPTSSRKKLLRIQRGWLVAIVVIWNRFELKALADSFRLSRSRSFCRCAAK